MVRMAVALAVCLIAGSAGAQDAAAWTKRSAEQAAASGIVGWAEFVKAAAAAPGVTDITLVGATSAVTIRQSAGKQGHPVMLGMQLGKLLAAVAPHAAGIDRVIVTTAVDALDRSGKGSGEDAIKTFVDGKSLRGLKADSFAGALWFDAGSSLSVLPILQAEVRGYCQGDATRAALRLCRS